MLTFFVDPSCLRLDVNLLYNTLYNKIMYNTPGIEGSWLRASQQATESG